MYELSKTITLSTVGDATEYSTGHLNGFVSDIYLSISKAAGAGDSVTISKSSAGDRTILKVTNPSTLGDFYHPRAIAVGSTNNSLNSTEYAATAPMSFYKEKFKVVCACSSGLAGETVTVKVRWY